MPTVASAFEYIPPLTTAVLASFEMVFYVYIIYSEIYDKYYIGQTNDVADRLRRHNNGCEKFTSSYVPWILKCVIQKLTRSEAMSLERKLKNHNREKIEKIH